MFLPALLQDVARGGAKLGRVGSRAFWRRFGRSTDRAPIWRLVANHGRFVRSPASGAAAGMTAAVQGSTTRYQRPYVGHSLDHVARRGMLLIQHRRLSTLFKPSFFAELRAPQAALWRGAAGADACSIWMRRITSLHGEGDIGLQFLRGEQVLHELSFCLVPDPRNPAGGGVAMLIARLQGVRGHLDAIREATRDCNDISPAHLLVAAAGGVATAMAAEAIYSVADGEQLSRHGVHELGCVFEYDPFWEALGGKRIGGWHRFDALPRHKPLLQLSIDLRRRVRRKRRFEELVADQARRRVEAFYLTAT